MSKVLKVVTRVDAREPQMIEARIASRRGEKRSKFNVILSKI